jgi:oligopeptidase B
MTTPDTLFELDMDTGERRVLKQQEVKGFDASHYRSEHLWITARDGVEVPVSLVYRREHFRKGASPLLVYGYGSYGASMDADFSASRLSLLDRGFVFAIAHIRGGGELGQQWYEDGKFCARKIPSTIISTSAMRCWRRATAIRAFATAWAAAPAAC